MKNTLNNLKHTYLITSNKCHPQISTTLFYQNSCASHICGKWWCLFAAIMKKTIKLQNSHIFSSKMLGYFCYLFNKSTTKMLGTTQILSLSPTFNDSYYIYLLAL